LNRYTFIAKRMIQEKDLRKETSTSTARSGLRPRKRQRE
jgi:hypothetical protein